MTMKSEINMDKVMMDECAQFGAAVLTTGAVAKVAGVGAVKSAVFTKLAGYSVVTKAGAATGIAVGAPVAIVGGLLIFGAAVLNTKYHWW